LIGLDVLTRRQREVFDFIAVELKTSGYPPTCREICRRFEFSSPNGALIHLRALQKKGVIHRKPGLSRAIKLLADPDQPAVVAAN
jgi:repressor LexA